MLASGRKKEVTPVTEIFGLFRDLDIPFADCAYPQFSPLYGLDKELIKNLRVHGHYGLNWVEDFMFPDGHPTDILFAQDATAALIRLLFPSSVGLVVNSGLRDKLNDILKPVTIARIFRLISRPEFLVEQKTVSIEGKKEPKSFMDLFETLMPEHEPLKARWNMCKENKFVFTPGRVTQRTYEYTLKLAKILFTAFKDNEHDKSGVNGYPRHVVERALLCYMWEKNKSIKANLKPYYVELARVERVDEKTEFKIINDPASIDKIIWEGSGSFYDKTHYENPGNIRPLEKSTLKKLGYAYFEDKFPVVIQYGISCKDGKKFYSDCGDSMLRNFFMMMLYNFKTKTFDVSKLKELRNRYNEAYIPLDKLIDYFENICTSLAQADTVWARNRWIVVVNNLNDYTLPDDGRNTKVRYRAKDGTQHEIDVGLDNIINVISKILGPALFSSNDMGGNMKKKVNWLSMLSAICQFFSEGYYGYSDENTWHAKLSTTNHKHDMEECEDFTGDVPEKGWVDLTLTFSYGNSKDGRKDIFECQIESMHFGFNKLYDHAEKDRVISLKSDISESIFGLRMNTYHEKIFAIDIIFNLDSETEQNKYLYIIQKWLDLNGTFFANWHNLKVNSALAKVLLKHMSVEEILGLRIPQLNYAIVLPLARMARTDDIKMVLIDDLNRFREESEFEDFIRLIKDKVADPPYNQNKFSTASRALEETLLKGTNEDLKILEHAEANSYVNIISGLTLLHLAAYAGNKRLTTSLSELDIDINAKTSHGDTPLHFGVRSGSAKTVQTLLAAGANSHAANKVGNTVSDIVSISHSKKIGLFGYFIGCSTPMDFIESPYSKKCDDNDMHQALKLNGQ